jgi:lipoprotein-anchoring transpeptidase ErfK/SrfK
LALSGAPFPVSQSDAKEISYKFRRREVEYNTTEPARTLVGYAKNRFFYHVHNNGRATRYGVAVGKKPARPSITVAFSF